MHANPTTSNHAPSTATTAATRYDSLNPYLKPKAVGPRDTHDRMTTYADEGIVYSYDQRDFFAKDERGWRGGEAASFGWGGTVYFRTRNQQVRIHQIIGRWKQQCRTIEKTRVQVSPHAVRHGGIPSLFLSVFPHTLHQIHSIFIHILIHARCLLQN